MRGRWPKSFREIGQEIGAADKTVAVWLAQMDPKLAEAIKRGNKSASTPVFAMAEAMTRRADKTVGAALDKAVAAYLSLNVDARGSVILLVERTLERMKAGAKYTPAVENKTDGWSSE